MTRSPLFRLTLIGAGVLALAACTRPSADSGVGTRNTGVVVITTIVSARVMTCRSVVRLENGADTSPIAPPASEIPKIAHAASGSHGDGGTAKVAMSTPITASRTRSRARGSNAARDSSPRAAAEVAACSGVRRGS